MKTENEGKNIKNLQSLRNLKSDRSSQAFRIKHTIK